MSDETATAPLRPAMPVLPSRAEPFPPGPLPAAEIAKLKKKRAKALKAKRVKKAAPAKRKARRRIGKHPALAAPYGKQAATTAPKNPNRPLEMKNQLQAVLAMTAQLKGGELAVFSASMQSLQELSRTGRRRVIAALAQVYP